MMSQQEYAIPRGSTVLITGANGYIASHVVDLLLELGFKVRGTVRSEKRWLDRFFEEKHGKGKFESVVVPRIDDEGAYDEVIKGVTGIVHVVCWNIGGLSSTTRNLANSDHFLGIGVGCQFQC
jgi:nucleoside-diphosphate-sugar epimerase